MSFKAQISDVFAMAGHEGKLVLMLNQVQGEPKDGDKIQVGQRRGVLIALADQGVRDRSCLTGQPVSSHCAILVALGSDEREGLYQSEIVGGENSDVL